MAIISKLTQKTNKLSEGNIILICDVITQPRPDRRRWTADQLLHVEEPGEALPVGQQDGVRRQRIFEAVGPQGPGFEVIFVIIRTLTVQA